MKKNILAENMRRFGTKNLTEQPLGFDLEKRLGFDSGANRDPKTGNMKEINWQSLKFEDINPADHPDYTDAYVSYAEYKDGTALTDDDMERLQHTHPQDVHNALMNYLH